MNGTWQKNSHVLTHAISFLYSPHPLWTILYPPLTPLFHNHTFISWINYYAFWHYTQHWTKLREGYIVQSLGFDDVTIHDPPRACNYSEFNLTKKWLLFSNVIETPGQLKAIIHQKLVFSLVRAGQFALAASIVILLTCLFPLPHSRPCLCFFCI